MNSISNIPINQLPDDPAELTARLIPDAELKPWSADEVPLLPSFASKIRECERLCRAPYSELPYGVQDALVLRRLQQMVNTALLNPLWAERLNDAEITGPPATFEDWERIPLSDKTVQRDMFMGARAGMVVPISRGGFQVVASGGTSDGLPLESVYSLRELHDTYRIAGSFMGTYQLREYLRGSDSRWLFTNLADYQMWSSGTMVGGVLQHVPGVNYVGAGPVTGPVLEHMFSYPGLKAMMGISAGIAILSDLGVAMPQDARESFRVALYGSGLLPQRKRIELQKIYPNVAILSYFAATQAETIGLQLRHDAPFLAAVPGLHLIEIVGDEGRAVAEGEEGELVVTRLHAHEAPLLRLKLGDRMIRRPALVGPGLKTHQFEFAGRSGDVLHLNDSQYSAILAYSALRDDLRKAAAIDLDEVAHEIQFVNRRERKNVTLVAAVDEVDALTHTVSTALGATRLQSLFAAALLRSLSLFNGGEATPATIEQSGYSFDLAFVHRSSPEIERTAVGKVPLVRDRAVVQESHFAPLDGHRGARPETGV
jgi:phenylacetate-CoA ligase